MRQAGDLAPLGLRVPFPPWSGDFESVVEVEPPGISGLGVEGQTVPQPLPRSAGFIQGRVAHPTPTEAGECL